MSKKQFLISLLTVFVSAGTCCVYANQENDELYLKVQLVYIQSIEPKIKLLAQQQNINEYEFKEMVATFTSHQADSARSIRHQLIRGIITDLIRHDVNGSTPNNTSHTQHTNQSPLGAVAVSSSGKPQFTDAQKDKLQTITSAQQTHRTVPEKAFHTHSDAYGNTYHVGSVPLTETNIDAYVEKFDVTGELVRKHTYLSTPFDERGLFLTIDQQGTPRVVFSVNNSYLLTQLNPESGHIIAERHVEETIYNISFEGESVIVWIDGGERMIELSRKLQE